MKLFHAALLFVFSVFMLGCPIAVDPSFPPIDPDADFFKFGLLTSNNLNVSGGIWGTHVWIKAVPELNPMPKSRPILVGPGMFFYAEGHGPNVIVIPFDEIQDRYYSNGMSLLYRPPANDEVPPEGFDVTFACEVYCPITERWERSPDYKLRVVHKVSPMNFYIETGPYWNFYNNDNSLSDVTVIAGELFEFVVNAKPASVEDIQFEYDLVRPSGYSGGLGELKVGHDTAAVSPYREWYYDYTAPEGISAPVDITFRVSIYDPWMKEKRVRELTLHVVPKE